MNSGRSNNLSLKYQSFTLSSCRDFGLNKSVCDKNSFPLQKSKYLLGNIAIRQKNAQIATNYTLLKSPWPSECPKTFEKF